MARFVVNLTGSFVLASSKIATFTVQKVGEGPLGVADNAGGVAADLSKIKKGRQFIQNEVKPTYLSGEGYEIIVDEAGS